MSKRTEFIDRVKHLDYHEYSAVVNSYDNGVRDGVNDLVALLNPHDAEDHALSCDTIMWGWGGFDRTGTDEDCNCYLSILKGVK